jgi:hypothetical protein
MQRLHFFPISQTDSFPPTRFLVILTFRQLPFHWPVRKSIVHPSCMSCTPTVLTPLPRPRAPVHGPFIRLTHLCSIPGTTPTCIRLVWQCALRRRESRLASDTLRVFQHLMGKRRGLEWGRPFYARSGLNLILISRSCDALGDKRRLGVFPHLHRIKPRVQRLRQRREGSRVAFLQMLISLPI